MQDAVAEGPRSVGTHTTVATAGARGAGSGGDAPGDVRLRPSESFAGPPAACELLLGKF